MIKVLAEAEAHSPEAARRFRRYARPRSFRLLLRAISQPASPQVLDELRAHFPPPALERILLRLLSWVPPGMARALEWRVRAAHEWWHRLR